MITKLPASKPPFVCLFCQKQGTFSSREHIVPESLGNDLVVLEKGWVCDICNNKFSSFESRVLFSSILGHERCRMGVTTKRNKPARAKTHGITWFAEPSLNKNVLSAEANWERVPLLLNKDGSKGKILFPVHDSSNDDIGKLLLKIGIEVLSPLIFSNLLSESYDLDMAKNYLTKNVGGPWPYFVLTDNQPLKHLISIFSSIPEVHKYVNQCGFDIFMHSVDEQPIIFFKYGYFFASMCLTNRDTDWRNLLLNWGASHVGCPKQYSEFNL